MKILWATSFDAKYYEWIFFTIQSSWDLLEGNKIFYMDNEIQQLANDSRAVLSNIDFSKSPVGVSMKDKKFWRKSQSFISAIRLASKNQYDYCIWLDADVMILKKPELSELLPGPDQIISVNHKTVIPGGVADLGLDTGFVAVNINHPQLHTWVDQYEEFWNLDEMETLTQKYDTYVLDRIINKHGYQWKNLWYGVHTHGKHYCGFEDSDLEKYFFHHWGKARKNALYRSTINN
jgi:hypothetical protein